MNGTFQEQIAAAIGRIESIPRGRPLLGPVNDMIVELRKGAQSDAEWQEAKAAVADAFKLKNRNGDYSSGQFRNILTRAETIPLRSNGHMREADANAKPNGHAAERPAKPQSPPEQEPPQAEQPKADDETTSSGYQEHPFSGEKYDLDDLGTELRKALNRATASVIAAKHKSVQVLKAVRAGAASLVEFDHDPSFDIAIAHLQAIARDYYTLSDDDIQKQISNGIRDALDQRARDQGKRSGKRHRERERDAEPPPAAGPQDFGLLPNDVSPDKRISLEDFWSHMPSGQYIFVPDGDMWPAKSVNSQIRPIQLRDTDGAPLVDDKGRPETIAASKWLDEHRHVEHMSWILGEPKIIRNRVIDVGGLIEHDGASIYNLYRPPMIQPGDPSKANPWIEHVRKIYGDYADHIIMWFAQRRQHPAIKINHVLLLSGPQGIGKDTMLVPIKYAVGQWNFQEASPEQALGRFKGFLKSVVLRLSEAKDLGEFDRFNFYEAMKTWAAAPPETLRLDEKYIKEYYVPNVIGIVVTSNHKEDGIYLPADDRRHFVAWTDLEKDAFPDEYWNKLHRWYADGGIGHVVAYLDSLDISTFDPKKPPPKTRAFWDIVDASRSPENAELADVLDDLGRPDAVTIGGIIGMASSSFQEWLKDRKNRRVVPRRMRQCGYVPIRNDDADDGLWKLNRTRQVIYAKAELSIAAQIAAVRKLQGDRQ